MATAASRRSQRQLRSPERPKTYSQSSLITLGCLLIVIGMAGLLNPEFMGLHLSAMHSLVLSASGCLSIWGAKQENSKLSYKISIVLGAFFAINAVAGFFLGKPGVPQVGYDARDELLIRVAPGFIELGMLDHIFHTILAVFFLISAYSWVSHRKRRVIHEV